MQMGKLKSDGEEEASNDMDASDPFEEPEGEPEEEPEA